MSIRMDSIIAKGAGVMKGVKARFEGKVGVFMTLSEQHAEAKVLMKRLQDDPDKKVELWPEIRRAILSHERAEMRDVYPLLLQHQETRALAEHHDEEAGDIERLIGKIDAADGNWQVIFDELVSAVIHHAEEEERTIFPMAQKVLGEKQVKDLTEVYLATQKQLADAV